MADLIGYARVSTADQDAALQVTALQDAGAARVFIDTASGSTRDRPQLTAALDFLRPGDTLGVWRLDRLGRSLPDLLAILAQIEEREVGFRSLTEALDTTTAGGRFIFAVFGAVAQFERELIVQRTNAGIAAARAAGKRPGRPRTMTPKSVEMARTLREQGRSLSDIADTLRVSRSTIYRELTPGPATDQ